MFEPISNKCHIYSMGDAELINGLINGEDTAVEQLLSLYGDRLYRSAYMLVGNEHSAKDLVQETFLQAIKSIKRFRQRSALYTWLHGILLNLSRSYFRKNKRLVFTDQQIESSEYVSAETDNLDKASAKSTLLECISQLSQSHREVIILRYYEDMRISDIAVQTGTSKGTVKSRLHYAKEALKSITPPELNLFASDGTN